MKTYQGSCHCGAVRFEAELDLAKGSMRCNCSFCLKIRCWAIAVPASQFFLLSGQADLNQYQFGARNETHYFCRHCGVRPFGLGNSAHRGIFYGVSVTCLDDVKQEELARIPINYIDGLHDEWDKPPAHTAHL